MLADQAAGLRKALAPPAFHTRLITGISSSIAHSATSANLAVALAAQGKEVLLMDASNSDRGASWLLGAEDLPDLMDAVCGSRDPTGLLFSARSGLRIMNAGRFLQHWRELKDRDLGALAQVLATLCEGFDVLIVDAPLATLSALPLADNAVIVSGTDSDSITRTYRLIKREAQMLARRRVSILLQALAPRVDADTIFANLAATTAQYLGIPLSSVGSIPDDPLARRALSMRQPVLDLFPRCEAATALWRCADGLLLCPEIAPASLHVFIARIVSAVRAQERAR
ncbi:MAG TPA: hypothetical protein VFB54_04605 [Burkholderiales bacterium]|nr:hypothetical protein [Burkholderiales bacterium]